MRANSRKSRMLLGFAAGVTVTALFGGNLAVPATAAPSPDEGKIKVADLANTSRVVKGKYLVETAGTPLVRGGSATANRVTAAAAESAVRAVGGKVGESYSDLWTGLSVSATEDQIKRLSRSASVKAVYPVLRVPMPKATKSRTAVSSELATIAAQSVTATGKGIKVGIIDSGVDYDHPDLGGSGTDGGRFPTARVTRGYDFVGDDYDSDSDYDFIPKPDADPDDCNGHGTHVAGIVGANGDLDTGGALGVAPQVTFGAYRVFGCEGSTDTEVILKAMTRAKKDGMQVVNLSLGSVFDTWPSYPDAVAAANLVKAGVVVVASAGNDGDLGLFAVGSPSVGSGVISVASYEPKTYRSRAIEVQGVKYPYEQVEGTSTAPATGAGPILERASNTTACTVPASVTTPGNALLVKRGVCSFSDKVDNAAAAGAGAVVIYNDTPGLDGFTTLPETYGVPAISISGAQGENLAGVLAGQGPQPLTWLDYQSGLNNPDGGKLSTFSSTGLAADLSLKPTLTAPGGKIYSTLPLEQDSYGNMSGTSMAAPFVAGSVALLLQAKPSLVKKPSTVAQLLYNTAQPVRTATEKTSTGGSLAAYPEAVFRQGSGLINLAGAVGAAVTASPSTLKLGEGTSRTVTITLTNKTKVTQTYVPSVVTGVSAAPSTGSAKTVGTLTPNYAYGKVGFKAPAKVKIKAGKSAKVKVKITAPKSILSGRAGMLYGGWVRFTTTGTGNTVSVPFAGVRGDYQAVKVLNGFRPVVNDAGATWKLPSLAYIDGNGEIALRTTAGHVYDMSSPDDVPLVLYHLDFPASDVRLKVKNTSTGKSYDAIINWDYVNDSVTKASSKSIQFGKQSRDAFAQGVLFLGAYYSKGKVKWVPRGNYTLQLRVLKPLGTAKKSSHWETFTTPKFRIG